MGQANICLKPLGRIYVAYTHPLFSIFFHTCIHHRAECSLMLPSAQIKTDTKTVLFITRNLHLVAFKHHHHQFKVIYYSMLAWVRLFVTIVFIQLSLSCARPRVTPSSRKSEAITCSQVFLGLPGSLLP